MQRIAGALRRRHGLKPGERVALAMENGPDLLPALYGIWRAGLSAVPMNSKLHAREMAWILGDCAAKLCIATPKLAEALSAPDLTGVPPIVADVPVSREAYGDAALFVDPADTSMISRSILQMLTDERARGRVLGAAPAVLSRYSWDTSARRTLEGPARARGRLRRRSSRERTDARRSPRRPPRTQARHDALRK